MPTKLVTTTTIVIVTITTSPPLFADHRNPLRSQNKRLPQDSAPYILSAKAAKVIPDPAGRNQGYTVAATTVFKSLDDMKFYDEGCEAHGAIKTFLKPRISGIMTVYFEV